MNWKDTLATVAPTIATAIGGPLGGIAARAGLSLLGIESNGDPESQLEDAVKMADPAALLALKKADQEFKTTMRSLDIKELELNTQDRSSAREMYAAKNEAIKPQIIIAAIYDIGFIAILYSIFGGGVEVAESMRETAMYLLGILSAGLVQVNNFFFGSSSGSKTKTLPNL